MPQQPQPEQSSSETETVLMHLPSGEVINGVVPAGLDDEQVKSYVRMKRPDLFGPPAGVPHPTTQDIGNQMVREQQSAGLAGVPGGSSAPQPASDKYAAAVGIPLAAAAVGMGGATALPFIRAAAARHPVASAMLMSEGISAGREMLPPAVKRFVPSSAALLPFFLAGGKGAAAESEAAARPPATDQVPGRPYMPNPRYTPPPEPKPVPSRTGPLLLEGEVAAPGKYPGANLPAMPTPEQLNPSLVSPTRTMPGQIGPERIYGPRPTRFAEPIPQREGLALPGEVAPSVAPGMPRSVANKTLDRTLTQAVGNEPIKRGVPLRQQGSAVVKNFRYDPQAQELHVTTHDGTTYVSGEVTPEQAQAFQDAPSKGQAWKAIRENSPLVGKVPAGGKRIAMKGAQGLKSASPTDEPPSNDLTEILTRSLREAQARR